MIETDVKYNEEFSFEYLKEMKYLNGKIEWVKLNLIDNYTFDSIDSSDFCNKDLNRILKMLDSTELKVLYLYKEFFDNMSTNEKEILININDIEFEKLKQYIDSLIIIKLML